MNKFLASGVVLFVAMAASGCLVSESKYKMAVEETEAARTELEKVRAQKNALEQQMKSIKESNAKLVGEAETALAELQRLKDSRDRDREAIEARIRDQEQKIKDLTAQQKALKQEYDEAKHRSETLQATVARYQKELKDRQRPVEMAPPAAARPPVKSLPAPPAPVAPAPKMPTPPTQPLPGASPVPSPPGQQAGLAPVNINKASANDMVLFLGLSKEVAERVVANRPYKLKGELVAKNVLPKGTFDVIKDRITVAP
jgi:DNA uptake protein ComE-like DNA-binding protein